MSVIITGATIIDGVAEHPLEGRSIWIEGKRIRAIIKRDEFPRNLPVETIDATGKYLIPGLMDANVHLMGDMRPENLIRYEGCYEDLATEAAQVALKSGLTTVFDTWGPRQILTIVRDRIAAGQVPGSRIYCGGNIVGLDGPFSTDFYARPDVVSAAVSERINAMFVENVGPLLSWMPPQQVADEVEKYIHKGVDFIKYASSEHRWGDPSAFLLFSPHTQRAIVERVHGVGKSAQAHASSVESLRAAVEAGCNLVQHCNITGPFAIPETTLELMCSRNTGAVIFPLTQRRFEWVIANCKIDSRYFRTSDINVRNLMRSGAMLLLATDSILFAPEVFTDPLWANFWLAPGEDNLCDFGRGHFVWLRAMEEKGYPAMEVLRAATKNIAIAYEKDDDLGTLEPGKLADILILDRNPLQSADNYRSIHMILKDGGVVDRECLPVNPIQTRPIPNPSAETLAYRAHRHIGRSGFPMLCC